MSKALAVQSATDIVSSYDEVERAAKAMAASGFFSDVTKVSQAIVKILAGREMGFGPFASMNGVHIIQGKPSIGANLMAAAVKANPHYDYRAEMSDTAVTITFYQDGQEIGKSSFSMDDAHTAQVWNKRKNTYEALADRPTWKSYPRNMLFARAMSNGVRWFCPGVLAGVTAYTPDELGADDVEGEVVTIEAPASDVGEVADAGPEWDEDAFDAGEDAGPGPDPVVEAGREMGATVKDAEDGPEPAPTQRSWPALAVQAVINGGYAKNAPQAVNLLNWSELDVSAGPKALAEWARVYREARNAGAEVAEAAGIANASLPQ